MGRWKCCWVVVSMHTEMVWQLFCRELKNKLESEQTWPLPRSLRVRYPACSKQSFRLKYLLGGGYMLWKGWDWCWVLTFCLLLLLWVVEYDRPSLQFSGENLLFSSRYVDVVIRADEYTAAVLIWLVMTVTAPLTQSWVWIPELHQTVVGFEFQLPMHPDCTLY